MNTFNEETVDAAFAEVDSEAEVMGFSVAGFLGKPFVRQIIRILALAGKDGVELAVKYLLALLAKIADDNNVDDE